MAKMLTDELLAQLLIEAWNDGFQNGADGHYNPHVPVSDGINRRLLERDFETLRLNVLIDKVAVK